MDSAVEDQRLEFTAFCHERYGSEDGEGVCPKSKTVTASKGKKIVAVLKGAPESETYCPKFRHWVRRRGFKLVSHSALGLCDVLCLPAKKPVSVLYVLYHAMPGFMAATIDRDKVHKCVALHDVAIFVI